MTTVSYQPFDLHGIDVTRRGLHHHHTHHFVVAGQDNAVQAADQRADIGSCELGELVHPCHAGDVLHLHVQSIIRLSDKRNLQVARVV